MTRPRTILLAAAVVLLTQACAPKRQSASPSNADRPVAARATVEAFLDAMKASDDDLLRQMIWPAYLEFNNLRIEECRVHAPRIAGYEIEDVSKDEVTARTWFVFGPGRRFKFRVARYGDKDYIFPGTHEGTRIDPWQEDTFLE